jgi:type 2 lantibiotic biosynthesis protein LanM
MLGATNFQTEDIIAAGEHPMLVNLGSLFQPHLARDDAARWQHPADKAYSESVLRVGLLPSNLSPDNCNHTVTCFANAYRLFVEHRDELLETVLPRFAHDETPLLLRPTNVYALMLSKSFHPNVLRDALQRDRYLDRLWSSVKEKPHLAHIISEEHTALLQGDIPVFTTYPDRRELYTSQGECIPEFFAVSGLKAVYQRLSQFEKEDLVRQTYMLRASFAAISMSINPKGGSTLPLRPSQTPLTRERLVGAACAVGERLCDLTLSAGDAVGWLGMTLLKKGRKEVEWALRPTSATLYDGTAGITLFLAYLGHITGETRYTTLARSALKTVCNEIERAKKMSRLTGIGAFNGWGTFIYLFTHLGVLWNEPALLQDAQEFAESLVDLIEKDDHLDIISGSAGCIAVLLSLYTVAPSASILAVAIQCGNHLLARAQRMKEGVGWCTISEVTPLAGFSHGAAGIAWSLFNLAAVSGQEHFQQVAVKDLAYERSLFSPEKQNWPDLRPEENSQVEYEPRYMSTWCHGASGIGLGRLASLPNLDDSRIREEIAIALNTTITNGFGHNHSLCHGDLGNLEPLLIATQVLGDPQYHEQLQEMSGMLLDSIERGGWVTGVPLGTETPGLMDGLSGIGYELLRLAEPERVPSVLLLAPPVVPSSAQV